MCVCVCGYVHMLCVHMCVCICVQVCITWRTPLIGRFKKGPGELSEITSDAMLKAACSRLEDGYRLTLWVYDKEQVCGYVVVGGGKSTQLIINL